MLSITNLSKSINGRSILSEINFKVMPGEITVIIGPSGGGKSTLLRCAALIDIPDKGEIVIDNSTFNFPGKYRNNHNQKIYPRLTIVFQQFHLWPHLTVQQNIQLPQTLGVNELNRDLYDYLVDHFEIANLIHSFPFQISEGEKQRVALIRAILLNPKYLLLDEITSALDVKQIGKVLSCIKELSKNGTAILLTTHLLGFASSSSDNVLFLNHGKIIESGGKSILHTPRTKLLKEFLTYMEHDT